MAENAVPQIFSRQRSSAKWRRGRHRAVRNDSAQYLSELIAEDMIERIGFMQLNPDNPLVVGDTTGAITTWLEDRGCVGKAAQLEEFDAEKPGATAAYDLIVHTLGLGHVNDLPGALLHARNALSSGGVFFAAFPGAGSLPSLRTIMLEAESDRPAARLHPLVDSRAGAALLQRAGFSRQVVDSFPVKVRFRELSNLVNDLRDHGLTSSLAGSVPLGRQALQRAQAAFDARRDGDGKVTETFEILTLTGWR